MQTNSTILITGCSSGFGKATALHFLERGWNVIATLRTPRPDSFPDSPRLLAVALDVTRPESIRRAVEQGIGRFGKIDAVVNNAGIGMFGAHEAVPDETIMEVFRTNTFGVMAVCREVIPHLRRQGGGVIVNVTSGVGIAPMPLVAVYTASKWAVEGFTQSLYYELRNFGIRAKIVQPGLAPATGFAGNSGTRCDGCVPPEYAAYAGRYLQSMQDYPAAYTTAEEVAATVHQAVTEEDDGEPFRHPAGADTLMLTALRRELPEKEFMQKISALFGGDPAGKR